MKKNADFECDNQGVLYLSEWISLIWHKENTGKTFTHIPNSLGWDTVTTYYQSGATHDLTEKNKTNIKKIIKQQNWLPIFYRLVHITKQKKSYIELDNTHRKFLDII